MWNIDHMSISNQAKWMNQIELGENKIHLFMVYFSLAGPEDVEDGQWFYYCKPKWIGASEIATPSGTNKIEQFFEIRFKIYYFIQTQNLFDEKIFLKQNNCLKMSLNIKEVAKFLLICFAVSFYLCVNFEHLVFSKLLWYADRFLNCRYWKN